MRTTVSIEDDVLEEARLVATRLRTSFRQVVNEALRVGLREIKKPTKQRVYRTVPHKMGLKPGMNLDNIGELLANIEGEEHR